VSHDVGYVDIGEQNHDAIIMVHGWPSIWSTWAKQIEAFEVCFFIPPWPYIRCATSTDQRRYGIQNEPYRLIVPDLRGFGYSTHPDDFKSSHTMQDLTNDLVCVLEDAKVASAICIGYVTIPFSSYNLDTLLIFMSKLLGMTGDHNYAMKLRVCGRIYSLLSLASSFL
jgi:pimeloyl-ACP methyl ester carboxylesterase